MAIGKDLVLLGILCAFFVVSHAATTDEDAMECMTFLQNFGYFTKDNMMSPSEIIGNEGVKRAVQNFQKFYKLTVTGEMDAETIEAMRMPRCGVPDPTTPNEDGDALGGKLNKRYAFTGNTWESSDLTYRIVSYPRNTPTRNAISDDDVDAIVATAFRIWSDQTPLTFRQTDTGYAEIYLSFGSYSHGDYYPFDGPDGTLAHAYSPGTFDDLAGDVHFDDSEYFTQESYQGYNLLQVAAHEIGHSLGMAHSNIYGALMYPAYTGYQPSFRLPDDDIRGIQVLYGSRANPNPDEPRPTYTSGDVEGCNKAFTAVSFLRGEIFGYQEDKYWRIQTPGVLLTDVDGDLNKYFWAGLPDNVDAGYERWFDSVIIFFKGEDYYLYDGNVIMDGPLPISTLTDRSATQLPTNIDAVLTFGEYDTTYFFKGRQVWRYNERNRAVDPGYPAPISAVFKGIPNDVTAAFRYKDGNTYFLKGKEYYRYNDDRQATDSGYPRLFGVDFLGCNTEEYTSDKNGTAAVTVSNIWFLVASSLVTLFFAL